MATAATTIPMINGSDGPPDDDPQFVQVEHLHELHESGQQPAQSPVPQRYEPASHAPDCRLRSDASAVKGWGRRRSVLSHVPPAGSALLAGAAAAMPTARARISKRAARRGI